MFNMMSFAGGVDLNELWSESQKVVLQWWLGHRRTVTGKVKMCSI